MVGLTSSTGMVTESDGVVYLISQDGSSLTALRGSDGHPLWTAKPVTGKAIAGPPTEENGMLYVLLQDNTLISIRMSDGQSIWHTQIPAFPPLPPYTTQFTSIRFFFDHGMLFLCNTPHTPEQATQSNLVYALSVSDGAILWHAVMGQGGSGAGFFFQAGTFYVAQGIDPEGSQGQGHATIDAWRDSDGRHLWHYQSHSAVSIPWGPQDRRDIVFLFNTLGGLDILRTSDGNVLGGINQSNQGFSTPAI
jgi:outer membrane protein assembly factor BamB